jgi:hypothetical protein
VNADTLRRLAAVDMPAEALREVLTIFAEIEGKNEERRARDAARKKEERDAKKAASKDNPRTIQGESKECPAEVPHAPAPAREEVLTSLDSNLSPTKSPPKGGPKGKVLSPASPSLARNRKTQIAEDAQPSEKDRAVAEREGMWPATFRHEWGLFRSRNLATGATYQNWHQAWVTWVQRWIGQGRKQIGSPPLRLAETGDKRVFVIRGSPQWTAWTAYLGKPKPTTQRGTDEGWYFESEWPPRCDNHKC